MTDTPRTDTAAIGFARILVDHGTPDNPKFETTEILPSNFARQLERELTTEYQRGLNAGLEQAARICDELETDTDRCRILNLTEQAWEEGQYACAEAIRAQIKK